MTLRSLKPLALALAVTVALAACQKTEAPVEAAAAPEAPEGAAAEGNGQTTEPPAPR